MSVKEYMKLIIYRVASKGLEVFLVEASKNEWKLAHLKSEVDLKTIKEDSTIIDLETFNEDDHKIVSTQAIEADYHDIPSLRVLLKEDVLEVREKLEGIKPDLDNGSFVAVKDAFKRVLPNEYKALKELKEIIIDRNQIMNL